MALFRRAGLIIGMNEIAHSHLMYAAVGTHYIEFPMHHENGRQEDDAFSVNPPEGHELSTVGGLTHHLMDVFDENGDQQVLHVNRQEFESLVQNITQSGE